MSRNYKIETAQNRSASR